MSTVGKDYQATTAAVSTAAPAYLRTEVDRQTNYDDSDEIPDHAYSEGAHDDEEHEESSNYSDEEEAEASLSSSSQSDEKSSFVERGITEDEESFVIGGHRQSNRLINASF